MSWHLTDSQHTTLTRALTTVAVLWFVGAIAGLALWGCP
jgi:hypothetical protein